MSDAPKHPADPANELARGNSAIDPRDFRDALGTFATGVTIVTAMAADGKPFGVTCNSFASVSLNPPLVLWSLGMFSQGLTVFQNASHFTVNVLGASQQELASQFAKSSANKFAGVTWTPGLGNAPVLADSVANFQCRAASRYYGGDHVIFLGAVEAYAYNRQEPLLFAHGGFGRFLSGESGKSS
jgi:flavin reductase (DIM6/NTAB) family NADH-FMN oxidoreductase RutF